MQIEYKNQRLRKVCTDADVARRRYGQKTAELIKQRIREIDAFDTVEEMIQFHIGRCHPLKGNRKGTYAVDLEHPLRMVFSVNGDIIEIALIEEIVDYH